MGAAELFVAPPVNGWILVVGAALPDPSDDVDAFFRFVTRLSRKLGQVQFFSASRILHYHGWVKAERGRVVRAYAWAGKLLWNQGAVTPDEKELGFKCFDYAEEEESIWRDQTDVIGTNMEKVPLLAARWGLDPAHFQARFHDEECGTAGELGRC
jgi:hypothetical protein